MIINSALSRFSILFNFLNFFHFFRSTLGPLPLGDDRRRLSEQEGKNFNISES